MTFSDDRMVINVRNSSPVTSAMAYSVHHKINHLRTGNTHKTNSTAYMCTLDESCGLRIYKCLNTMTSTTMQDITVVYHLHG